MKNLLIILLFVLATAPVFSQNFKGAYYGESITHYGLKAGYERQLRNAWLYSGNLAIYRHPHNHIGVIVSPEIAWRPTNKKGRFFEAAFAPSLFRSFYEGSTYKVNENNSFEKIPLAGRTAFMPAISLGFGKDLSMKRYIPLMWYGRVNVMRQFPYNASSLMRVSIEAGVIIKKTK